MSGAREGSTKIHSCTEPIGTLLVEVHSAGGEEGIAPERERGPVCRVTDLTGERCFLLDVAVAEEFFIYFFFLNCPVNFGGEDGEEQNKNKIK